MKEQLINTFMHQSVRGSYITGVPRVVCAGMIGGTITVTLNMIPECLA